MPAARCRNSLRWGSFMCRSRAIAQSEGSRALVYRQSLIVRAMRVSGARQSASAPRSATATAALPGLCLNPCCGRLSRPGAVLPRQPLAQESNIAAIGAPHHVEGVADDWHRADKPIERHHGEHWEDDVKGRAQLMCLAHDVKRDRGGDRIADPGNEPDQRIKAEAHIGAGQNEGRVQQRRQRIEPCDALGPRARACEIETVGETVPGITVGHGLSSAGPKWGCGPSCASSMCESSNRASGWSSVRGGSSLQQTPTSLISDMSASSALVCGEAGRRFRRIPKASLTMCAPRAVHIRRAREYSRQKYMQFADEAAPEPVVARTIWRRPPSKRKTR